MSKGKDDKTKEFERLKKRVNDLNMELSEAKGKLASTKQNAKEEFGTDKVEELKSKRDQIQARIEKLESKIDQASDELEEKLEEIEREQDDDEL